MSRSSGRASRRRTIDPCIATHRTIPSIDLGECAVPWCLVRLAVPVVIGPVDLCGSVALVGVCRRVSAPDLYPGETPATGELLRDCRLHVLVRPPATALPCPAPRRPGGDRRSATDRSSAGDAAEAGTPAGRGVAKSFISRTSIFRLLRLRAGGSRYHRSTAMIEAKQGPPRSSQPTRCCRDRAAVDVR